MNEPIEIYILRLLYLLSKNSIFVNWDNVICQNKLILTMENEHMANLDLCAWKKNVKRIFSIDTTITPTILTPQQRLLFQKEITRIVKNLKSKFLLSCF